MLAEKTTCNDLLVWKMYFPRESIYFSFVRFKFANAVKYFVRL